MRANILVLALKAAMPLPVFRQVRERNESMKKGADLARRRVIIRHLQQLVQPDPCLLEALTPRGGRRVFTGVDPPGNRLQSPRVKITAPIGPHAKLLDQEHPVAPGIIGQDKRCIPSQENLPLDLRALGTAKERMAQPERIRAEEPEVTGGRLAQ